MPFQNLTIASNSEKGVAHFAVRNTHTRRKKLQLSGATFQTFQTSLLALVILSCQQPFPRRFINIHSHRALFLHASLQQGRGLMKTLGLVWPKRTRSLKLRYHDLYAADSVDSKSVASDCLLYERKYWNVLYSYSFGPKILFLRPELWLLDNIYLCSPTTHLAAYLDELGMYFHFISFENALSFSFTVPR